MYPFLPSQLPDLDPYKNNTLNHSKKKKKEKRKYLWEYMNLEIEMDLSLKLIIISIHAISFSRSSKDLIQKKNFSKIKWYISKSNTNFSTK